MTPLHCANLYRHTDIVRMLLHHRADATAKDYSGKTPWRVALEEGAIEIIEILDYWEDFAELK